MAARSEKERRKLLKQQYLRHQQRRKEEHRYLSRDDHVALLDYLDRRLRDEPCDHTLRRTGEWARENGVSLEALQESLALQGGYCDCEVLANTEVDD